MVYFWNLFIEQAEFSIDSDLKYSFDFIETIPVYVSRDLDHLIMLLSIFDPEIQEGPFLP